MWCLIPQFSLKPFNISVKKGKNSVYKDDYYGKKKGINLKPNH